MAELIYSLNGKYFKDFDIFISSSDGLFDGLKPKKQNTYDWAEYSGVASDITQIKRFDVRKFTLTGFVTGESFDDMISKFWTVFQDLNKPGRQRLIVKPFSNKTRVFDVTLEDAIDIKKVFKDGKSYALFTIKLIEQKPIKKILYFDKNDLQLSFTSTKWVEVNIDGNIETHKGQIVINRPLPKRSVTGYYFEGKNLLRNSNFPNDINFWASSGAAGATIVWSSGEKALYLDNGNNAGAFLQDITLPAGKYVLSFDVKPGFQTGSALTILTDNNSSSSMLIHTTTEYKRYSVKLTLANNSTYIAIQADQNQRLYFKNIKLEKGNIATDWTPSPEDQHYISIAGEIDEITNLITNAEVLWEKL